MNITPKHLLAAFATLLLVACNSRTAIDEQHAFAGDSWLRFEPVQFQADINDASETYCVSVTLRYDTNLLTDPALPLMVEFYIDSLESHSFPSTIRLRDRRGQLRGTTIGNYCTVCDTIDRVRTYNQPGTYTYSIIQRTSRYEQRGVASVGLRIERN